MKLTFLTVNSSANTVTPVIILKEETRSVAQVELYERGYVSIRIHHNINHHSGHSTSNKQTMSHVVHIRNYVTAHSAVNNGSTSITLVTYTKNSSKEPTFAIPLVLPRCYKIINHNHEIASNQSIPKDNLR
eukprot:TRINITY_DN13_c0_g1_i15.p1 TRINITY_DN13_c0_g1~~TRINITY_DN13_c0_g1_i15.p1  ORF type:complete len:131 (-),score=8.13 TRINITY_DN13_c0_g1_i15:207-599(-)